MEAEGFGGSYMTSLLSLVLFVLKRWSGFYSDETLVTTLAPALYVFGDSLVDSGNNNYLPTQAKVNYTPYGIVFPFGATGRFTNGRTMADFISQSLGLPFSPPVLGLSDKEKREVLTGINYASGSAGILCETGRAIGMNLNMDDQINLFQKTVLQDLPSNFKEPLELWNHISKSIFFIIVGSNDYINNYLQPDKYNSSRIYTPEQFASLLVCKHKQQLQKLYKLGVRKLVVFEIPPIGCVPDIVNKYKPITTCDENVNDLVIPYNIKFHGMLHELSTSLKLLTIVHGDTYWPSYTANQIPLIPGRIPCCITESAGGLCEQDEAPCEDMADRLYWDEFHPVEDKNRNVAIGCFNGSTLCFPINIEQLASKK